MNSGRQQWAIAILATAIFLDITMAARGQSFSLYSASNSASTNLFSASAVNPADQVIPVIEMKGVPFSVAITQLEQEAGVSYPLNMQLSNTLNMTDDEGLRTHDPLVNFRWTNITAQAALLRLLDKYQLTIYQSPLTMVSLITFKDEAVPPMDAVLLGTGTNLSPLSATDTNLPLISFEDVPITLALKHLARQALLNYLLDPEIGYGQQDENGNTIHEPTITHRWTNATASAVFAAVCRHYRLPIVRDPHTGVVLVRFPGHDVNFVKPDFYGTDTNVIPLIQFEDVPLSIAVQNLAQQMGTKYILSPRIESSGPGGSEPQVTVRCENLTAKQALAALCENYDLEITLYPISGIVRIEPGD